MNTLIDHAPEVRPAANTTTGASAPADKSPHRRARNGLVARLPRSLRESICRLMEDGFQYPAIIEKLDLGAHRITKHHLSEWKQGGFRDWQDDQQWIEELRHHQQFGLELLQSGGETKMNRVVIQIAVTHVMQMLRRLAPAKLVGEFDTDAANFTRLMNSISRLSRESLVLTKYDHVREAAQAAEVQKMDPTRKLAEKERDIALGEVERFFGFNPDKQIGPTLAEFFTHHPPAVVRMEPTPSPIVPPFPLPNPNLPNETTMPAVPELASPFSDQPVPPTEAEPNSKPIPQTTSESSIKTPESRPPIENQNSEIKNTAELCPGCNQPVPPLLPNGERPYPHCKSCGLWLPDPSPPLPA
jgi:hypothetical protein